MKKFVWFPIKGLVFFFLLNFLSNYSAFAQGINLNGVIRCDKDVATNVSYVNIGISGANVGTVSDDSGRFNIFIPEEYLNDTLIISKIGYHNSYIPIYALKNQRNSVVLSERIYDIPEATIASSSLKRVIKGNKSRAKSIVMAVNSDTANLGREIGTVIKLPKKEVLIKDFNFHVLTAKPDSAKFRLNIYSFGKAVGQSLLDKNIFFTVYKDQTGDFSLDLSEYRINTGNDVFVSIETVAIYMSTQADPAKKYDKYYYDRVTISGTLTGSKSFRRKVSHGSWEQISTFSPGFWISILK